MSNIDSSGGVRGRVGRSMDYSQLLTIRKQDILTSAYRGAVEDSKPVVFNRDKKTSGFDNGVVQVYFQKGLFLSSSRGGNVGYGSGRSFTMPLGSGGPDPSGLTAAEAAVYINLSGYTGILGEYNATHPTVTRSEVEAALALVTNLPITITYRGGVASVSVTITGNIENDATALMNAAIPSGATEIVVYYT